MLAKNYDHIKESALYERWENAQLFQPRASGRRGQKRFCIIMPPPNANGSLHLGHALEASLQDALTRYHRMRGEETLWLPGADHAGILTQVVYERVLAKEGKTRFDLGREKFIEATYRFTLKNRAAMEAQLRRLGASCDWTRSAFTLEPRFEAPIAAIFKKLYDEGLMYRGERPINWCPRCQTALSDLEIKHEPEKTTLYHIRYNTKDGGGSVTVATARPETMLGDTAVAVHPKDQRWQKLIGQKVAVPLVNRLVPVVADEAVDPEFGTGAVKVTPAHDALDFTIAQRHRLPALAVIDFEGQTTSLAGPYQKLPLLKARAKVIEDLRRQGALVKEEPHDHNVAHCERCGTLIEILLSLQWFVRMKPLARPARAAVKAKKVVFSPAHFEKLFMDWLANIQDWCVSRQIWWGHQLPVWYCGSATLTPLQKTLNRLPDRPGCGAVIVAIEPPKQCPKCGATHELVRDPDTLDTWFSSGQWPFNALGWDYHGPAHAAPDFHRFYPTTVMDPGYEILYLWVARMVMLGLYVTGAVPFKTVLVHGILRDLKGQKMSKSKGNVVDPGSVIDRLGTDSLRFALLHNTSAGNDLKFNVASAEAGRNFANKLWHIARFFEYNKLIGQPRLNQRALKNFEDKWLAARLTQVTQEVTAALDARQVSQALGLLYEFIWHDLADWYVEIMKARPKAERRAPLCSWALATILKLLHPFMPFVTETIWQAFFAAKREPFLTIAPWPVGASVKPTRAAIETFEQFRALVRAARHLKQLTGLKAGAQPTFHYWPASRSLAKIQATLLNPLVGAAAFKIAPRKAVLPKGAKSVGHFGTLVLPAEAETLKTLKRKLVNDQKTLTRRWQAKKALLNNSAFMTKAPAAVVTGIQTEVAQLDNLIDEIETALSGF